MLDGDSDKMRELLLFLREKGDTAVLQYQPEETGWKSTEELYRVFHSIEEDRLKTSEIKCVKENKALKESLDLLCFAASAAYFRSYGTFFESRRKLYVGRTQKQTACDRSLHSFCNAAAFMAL